VSFFPPLLTLLFFILLCSSLVTFLRAYLTHKSAEEKERTNDNNNETKRERVSAGCLNICIPIAMAPSYRNNKAETKEKNCAKTVDEIAINIQQKKRNEASEFFTSE